MRQRIRLSTKGGAEPTVPHGYPEHVEGLSRPALSGALAGSLDRLQPLPGAVLPQSGHVHASPQTFD